MFFLAGLLGMMALGSIAIVSTGAMADSSEDDDDRDAYGPEQDEEDFSGDADFALDGDGLDGDGHQADGSEADGTDAGTTRDAGRADASDTNTLIEELSDDPVSPPGASGVPGAEATSVQTFGLPDVSPEAPTDMPTDAVADVADVAEPPATGLIPGSSAAGSLFAQMGLINTPEMDGAGADSALTGTEASDTLLGGAADELIYGLGAGDDLQGGDGADSLSGGAGDDTLYGDGGNDLVMGDDGDDTAFGDAGEDTMLGGAGDDAMHAGTGDDLLDGGTGDDQLHGREGEDTLTGGLGEDTLFGGWGNDLVSGIVRGADGSDTDDQDFLNGGDGDDTMGVGAGDWVHGGEGADVLVLGDWITSESEAAYMMDYDAQEDQILIVYDDSASSDEPEVQIRPTEGDPDMSEIVMDGVVLSTLPTADAPPLESIVLVGESLATEMAFG